MMGMGLQDSSALQVGLSEPMAASLSAKGDTKDRHRAGPEGYTWTKYGHKVLSGVYVKRYYYACGMKDTCGCSARKIVDRDAKAPRGDYSQDIVTLQGQHNHAPLAGPVAGGQRQQGEDMQQTQGEEQREQVHHPEEQGQQKDQAYPEEQGWPRHEGKKKGQQAQQGSPGQQEGYQSNGQQEEQHASSRMNHSVSEAVVEEDVDLDSQSWLAAPEEVEVKQEPQQCEHQRQELEQWGGVQRRAQVHCNDQGLSGHQGIEALSAMREAVKGVPPSKERLDLLRTLEQHPSIKHENLQDLRTRMHAQQSLAQHPGAQHGDTDTLPAWPLTGKDLLAAVCLAAATNLEKTAATAASGQRRWDGPAPDRVSSIAAHSAAQAGASKTMSCELGTSERMGALRLMASATGSTRGVGSSKSNGSGSGPFTVRSASADSVFLSGDGDGEGGGHGRAKLMRVCESEVVLGGVPAALRLSAEIPVSQGTLEALVGPYLKLPTGEGGPPRSHELEEEDLHMGPLLRALPRPQTHTPVHGSASAGLHMEDVVGLHGGSIVMEENIHAQPHAWHSGGSSCPDRASQEMGGPWPGHTIMEEDVDIRDPEMLPAPGNTSRSPLLPAPGLEEDVDFTAEAVRPRPRATSQVPEGGCTAGLPEYGVEDLGGRGSQDFHGAAWGSTWPSVSGASGASSRSCTPEASSGAATTAAGPTRRWSAEALAGRAQGSKGCGLGFSEEHKPGLPRHPWEHRSGSTSLRRPHVAVQPGSIHASDINLAAAAASILGINLPGTEELVAQALEVEGANALCEAFLPLPPPAPSSSSKPLRGHRSQGFSPSPGAAAPKPVRGIKRHNSSPMHSLHQHAGGPSAEPSVELKEEQALGPSLARRATTPVPLLPRASSASSRGKQLHASSDSFLAASTWSQAAAPGPSTNTPTVHASVARQECSGSRGTHCSDAPHATRPLRGNAPTGQAQGAGTAGITAEEVSALGQLLSMISANNLTPAMASLAVAAASSHQPETHGGQRQEEVQAPSQGVLQMPHSALRCLQESQGKQQCAASALPCRGSALAGPPPARAQDGGLLDPQAYPPSLISLMGSQPSDWQPGSSLATCGPSFCIGRGQGDWQLASSTVSGAWQTRCADGLSLSDKGKVPFEGDGAVICERQSMVDPQHNGLVDDVTFLGGESAPASTLRNRTSPGSQGLLSQGPTGRHDVRAPTPATTIKFTESPRRSHILPVEAFGKTEINFGGATVPAHNASGRMGNDLRGMPDVHERDIYKPCGADSAVGRAATDCSTAGDGVDFLTQLIKLLNDN